METLRIKTTRRTELVDVTGRVSQVVAEAGISEGVCFLYVPHTTAAVLMNEHADPDVARDLEGVFDRLVPQSGHYWHREGNADAHAKAALAGASRVVFVEGRKLVLGPWQGIFFCEFDGPRERRLYVKVVADGG